jgi:hypothetical protein
MSKTELCIMPKSELYSTERFEGSHRHEVFFGTSNRQKSIKYGLVVFLKPEMHNMSNQGVHFNKAFDNELKQIGQKIAMEKYNWSTEDFIRIFGKNYL